MTDMYIDRVGREFVVLARGVREVASRVAEAGLEADAAVLRTIADRCAAVAVELLQPTPIGALPTEERPSGEYSIFNDAWASDVKRALDNADET